jgi:hypothetical protein
VHVISQKLVHLIETNADELTERWLKNVRIHPDTPTYRTFSDERLKKRALDVYAHLGRWVGYEEHHEEVERSYAALGAERCREGFALSEVLAALILTKNELWKFVQERGFFDSALQLYQTLELHNRVVAYFDRAVLYTARGYEEAARRGLRQTA